MTRKFEERSAILEGDIHMKLTLSVDNLSTLGWWGDTEDGIHDDFNGRTGSMMTLVKGALMSFSHGQKLDGCSSTKAELIVIDNATLDIMWRNTLLRPRATP